MWPAVLPTFLRSFLLHTIHVMMLLLLSPRASATLCCIPHPILCVYFPFLTYSSLQLFSVDHFICLNKNWHPEICTKLYLWRSVSGVAVCAPLPWSEALCTHRRHQLHFQESNVRGAGTDVLRDGVDLPMKPCYCDRERAPLSTTVTWA